MKIRLYRAMLACGVVLAGIGLVRGADAQTSTTQPGDTLEEVVVTGSLIRQPNITATSPLTTIDRKDLEQQDSSDIQNVLLRSPEVYAGTNSMTGFTSNAGASTLSLRNLGSNRTLVLIDGQRLAPTDPAGYGAADISTGLRPADEMDLVQEMLSHPHSRDIALPWVLENYRRLAALGINRGWGAGIFWSLCSNDDADKVQTLVTADGKKGDEIAKEGIKSIMACAARKAGSADIARALHASL